MRSQLAVSALAILSAAVSPLAAAAAPDRLDALVLERLGAEDGLSHGAVYAIAQDGQGFLWIGTPAGLDRFDGYEAVHLGSELGTVAALLVDRQDRFWIGSSSGLHRLDRTTGELAAIELAPRTAPPSVRALAEDGAGRVWIGAGARLLVVDGASPREVVFEHAPDEDPRATIVGFSPSYEAGLLAWLIELSPPRTTLLRLRPGSDAVRVEHPPADWGRAGQGLVDRQGRLWLDPWHSAVASNEASWSYHNLDGSRRSLVQSRVCEDHLGRLWFASTEGIHLRSDDREPPLQVIPGSSRSNWQQSQLISCLTDRAGRVWMGSLGGLFVWDPYRKPFVHLRHDPADPESLGGDPVSSLVEDTDGQLWVGSFGGGLSLLDRADGRAHRFRHEPGSRWSLCDDRVWSLAAAADGGLWIGTEAGLCRMLPGATRFTSQAVPSLPSGEGDSRIKSIAPQEDGVLWLGTNFGLFRVDPSTGEDRRYTAEAGGQGLASRQVGALLLEEPGALWIGSTDGDLQRLDLRSGRIASTHLLDGGRPALGAIYDLARDAAGDLWVGTHLGLARLDEEHGRLELLDLGSQLPSRIVYSLLSDSGERLWLGTARGLVRLGTGSWSTDVFGLGEGIGNLEYNRHAALQLADGTMVFGGMSGLTLFRPEEIRGNPEPPPVALTAVHVLSDAGERSLPAFGLETVELDHHDRALTVEFTALAFTQAARSRYSYRLEGLEPNWVEAGEQRLARYTNLPAGSYVLRIKAANGDGVWNEEGLSLPIRVLPAFWHTWWFRACLLLAVSLLLVTAYQLRVRNLLALQRMRLRIAGDLHDELGSELSGIALVAAMLRERASLAPGDRDRLAQVETTSRRVMHGLRDIVWYINPEHDTAGSLAARMRLDAELLLGNREREIAITVEDPDAPLPMDRRRHLFLAYRELLHNVNRHAGECSARVRFELRADAFELEVADDGRGFDPAAAVVGTGLASLRRRAEQLGAVLEIDSRPKAGTRIRMCSK